MDRIRLTGKAMWCAPGATMNTAKYVNRVTQLAGSARPAVYEVRYWPTQLAVLQFTQAERPGA